MMMKLLNKVSTPPSYIRRHNEIVDAKTKAVVRLELQAIRPDVTKRFRIFQSAVRQNNLHTIRQDNVMRNSKDSLLSCYKNKTVKTKAIFSDIESAQIPGSLGKCPYCGITRPGTYDHYMPEEEYPEFAVHGLNLIPCCTECNSSKGVRVMHNGQRQYLHFYSDSFPDEQFLHVSIITRPNSIAYGARFTLRKPNQYNQLKWNVIETHYRKLKLLDRYKNEANDEISTTFDTVKAHIMNDGSSVESFLNSICDSEEVKFGKSHWRIVLKRQLAQMPDFVNYVNAECGVRFAQNQARLDRFGA
jgi:5-methylcytosine-specific restriction endonuclease McrA